MFPHGVRLHGLPERSTWNLAKLCNFLSWQSLRSLHLLFIIIAFLTSEFIQGRENFFIFLTYIGDLHTFPHPSDIVYINSSKQSTPTIGHLQFRIQDWPCTLSTSWNHNSVTAKICNTISSQSWQFGATIKATQLGSHCSDTCFSLFQCYFVMVFRWNCPSSRPTLKGTGEGKSRTTCHCYSLDFESSNVTDCMFRTIPK